nr:hypothetical protein [Tanacetum cinerariifolium]
MKSKYSSNEYMYCADHAVKLVREQWVDTVDHDGEWIEAKEGEDSDEVQAVSFYPRVKTIEPLKWKAPENRLKPSSARLLEVLRNHKGAIALSITDIKRINSSFFTHKILVEDEFKPSVQPQRRVSPNIKELVKKEVIKLLDVGLIYLIFDSPWVSPVQLSLRVKNETVTFNIEKSMKSKYSSNEYMYCADHAVKLVREQWVDTVDHDGEWIEAKEWEDSDEILDGIAWIKGKFHSYINFRGSSISIDVIDEILEEDFDALLDECGKILHSIEGTLLEEEIFVEFTAMNADENSDFISDTEEPPFEKIAINTNYKIKTSLE